MPERMQSNLHGSDMPVEPWAHEQYNQPLLFTQKCQREPIRAHERRTHEIGKTKSARNHQGPNFMRKNQIMQSSQTVKHASNTCPQNPFRAQQIQANYLKYFSESFYFNRRNCEANISQINLYRRATDTQVADSQLTAKKREADKREIINNPKNKHICSNPYFSTHCQKILKIKQKLRQKRQLSSRQKEVELIVNWTARPLSCCDAPKTNSWGEEGVWDTIHSTKSAKGTEHSKFKVKSTLKKECKPRRSSERKRPLSVF